MLFNEPVTTANKHIRELAYLALVLILHALCTRYVDADREFLALHVQT